MKRQNAPELATVGSSAGKEANKMEQQQLQSWEIAAIEALGEIDVVYVEDRRAYISSKIFGTSRFLLVEQHYNESIQLEQINDAEKGDSRVVIQVDELPCLLKVLLCWYLEARKPPSATAVAQEPLYDLDERPF
jgi:hypothetical protein